VQQKPMKQYQERIIAGMGSGDSSDVNTYAMADRLYGKDRKYNMRDHTKIIRGLREGAIGSEIPGEDATKPIDAHAIADTFDRAYTRDPKTKKLKLKKGLPTPDPKLGQDYK